MGGEVNSESKREWVFDGTRGEFWTFLIITGVYFAFVIRGFIHALGGFVPHAKVITRYSPEEFILTVAFVGFFILTIAFRVFGKWFTAAFTLKTAHAATQIFVGYRNVSGTYALEALALLDYISTLLLFIAFSSYIVKRLRREPLNNSTESNPV